MTATFPDTVVLQGHGIRLEPLEPRHLPALWRAIGRPEVFAGGYGGGPAGLPDDEAAFSASFPIYSRHEAGGRCWVVTRGGEVVGSSSLLNIDLEKEHVEIGCTAYAPEVWGTEVNPATKLLLLTHAFDHGFGRVALRADERNARSRAAIVKLGATFEGIMRRDTRRADGSWRDTAVHSITIDDWPAVRAGLEARLAAFGAAVVTPRD
jgi:RimJ/RimL family protein N-acetyltransferase